MLHVLPGDTPMAMTPDDQERTWHLLPCFVFPSSVAFVAECCVPVLSRGTYIRIAHLANCMAGRRGNRNPKASRNRDLTSANHVRLNNADEFALQMIQHLKAATAAGCETPTHRAKWLNDKGIQTQQGKEWRHEGVRRLVRRIVRLRSAP